MMVNWRSSGGKCQNEPVSAHSAAELCAAGDEGKAMIAK